MSAVNEWVAREYFEALGYLVTQPRKFTVPGRQKTSEEEVDLLVYNPTVAEHVVPEDMIWGTEHLRGIARAVVGIRGWHTDRFSATTFEQTPDILRFAEGPALKYAAGILGTDRMAKVLCLPRLPASGDLRKNTIKALRDKGIDGVISFRTMLLELVSRVETKKNYEKSDLLQIVRLLKNYDLLKDDQLELFARRRRPRSRPRPAPAAPPPLPVPAAGGDTPAPERAAP
jgi:hypothetical protein